jgi:putative endonuclease
MSHSRQSLETGQQAESMALAFLQAQGLQLRAQNFRCPLGEIDLILRDKHCWVFVEVKNRKNTTFGHPAETVTRAKQRKIYRAAEWFLREHKIPADAAMRFDVVTLINLQANSVQWFRNAFDAPGA